LVGIVVPLVYPAYFSAILAGAAEALSERDLQIVLSPTGPEHDREVSVLDRLHGLTDGALIILPEETSEELERLRTVNFGSSCSTPSCRSTNGSRQCRPRMRVVPTRRCGTCSSSGTGGSRRSRARAAGWLPRIVAAATALRLRPRVSYRILHSR
jgi:hypothetical protein